MERQPDQTAFVGSGDVRNQGVDIEKRHRQQGPVLDDANAPALLDDEQALAVARRRGEKHRHLEAGGHQLGAERGVRRRRTAGRQPGGEQHDGSQEDGAGTREAQR